MKPAGRDISTSAVADASVTAGQRTTGPAKCAVQLELSQITLALSPPYMVSVVTAFTVSAAFGSMVITPVPTLRIENENPFPSVAAAVNESVHVPVARIMTPISDATTVYAPDFATAVPAERSVRIWTGDRSSITPVPADTRPFIVLLAACGAAAATNAVVAICVVLVPTAAVGAAGTPVSVGEARGAFSVSISWIACWTFVDAMLP